jgi:hypothetical protein
MTGAAIHDYASSNYHPHPSSSSTSSKDNISSKTGGALPSEPVMIGPVSRESASPSAYQLPMLASQCPGWVCYAEKTQPQSIPYISTTKSAQQILGVLLKRVLLSATGAETTITTTETSSSSIESSIEAGAAAVTGVSSKDISGGEEGQAKEVYLVSIQPCFDKKLEGSRKVHQLPTRCFYATFCFVCRRMFSCFPSGVFTFVFMNIGFLP